MKNKMPICILICSLSVLAAADAGLNVKSFYKVMLSGDRLYINTGLTTGIFEFVRVE